MWLLPSVVATIIVVVTGGLLARANYLSSLISVPDLSGRPGGVAEESTHLSGLLFEVSGQRFSADVPQGSVLSQEPAANERVRSGTTVRVVLSAGSETMNMPDVVGMSLQEAREYLRDRGLGVVTQDVVSDALADTVLESFPAPGVEVHTGTTVRLSLAIGGAAGDSLLPYDLRGTVIAIDPAPTTGQIGDVALDIARRVRSLLEASGATVSVTRSITETVPTDVVRSSLLASPTPDAAVGLSFAAVGQSGVTAVIVRSSDASAAALAEAIAKSFTASVRLPGQTVNAYRTEGDAVLGKVRAPGVRILLGEPGNTADAFRFADPNWADAIARALYRALGETFAPR